MPDSVLSPVSTLCLAILHRGEATGYDVKKESQDGDYRYFVDASFGSIYPALARLAADELVTVRDEPQVGRPARKVYAITDKGRSALLDALSAPPGPDIFRSRFLLVSKFAENLPAEVLRRAVEDRRKHLEDEIAHLAGIADECPDSPALQWITDYGRACLGASLDFINARGDELVATAQDVKDAAE